MTDEEKAIATIDFLNEKAGRKFKHTKANKDIIIARINEGYTAKDLATVTLYKIRDWNNDPKMSKYIRPATLYNRTKFEAYLNEIEAEKAVKKAIPDNSSLINQDYQRDDNQEAEYEKHRAKLLEEMKANREESKKPKEAKKEPEQPFDSSQPFHLGSGDNRKDWDSYDDFVQETLVRWDIIRRKEEEAKQNIINMLPASVQKGLKDHESTSK